MGEKKNSQKRNGRVQSIQCSGIIVSSSQSEKVAVAEHRINHSPVGERLKGKRGRTHKRRSLSESATYGYEKTQHKGDFTPRKFENKGVETKGKYKATIPLETQKVWLLGAGGGTRREEVDYRHQNTQRDESRKEGRGRNGKEAGSGTGQVINARKISY